MDTYRGTTTDAHGRPVGGATVAVFTAGTTTLANLYSEAGTVGIANPITSDANGYYVFSAADGTYDISYSGSGLAGEVHRNVKLWDFATASAAPFSQVSLTAPSDTFVITGSPAGADGTIAIAYKDDVTAAYVVASPGGAAGILAPRALAKEHLPASGAVAATYGSATASFAGAVDAYGRITSASNITITPAFASLTSVPTTLLGHGIADGVRCAFVATANKTIGNTVTETTMFGTGEGSLTIAADSAVAGTTYRVTVRGYVSVTSAATIGLKLKIGAYELIADKSGNITVASSVPFTIAADITYRTIGATGTVVATMLPSSAGLVSLFAAGGMVAVLDFVNTAETTVNTTIDGDLDLTWKFSVANAGNTVTVQTATVEVLRG